MTRKHNFMTSQITLRTQPSVQRTDYTVSKELSCIISDVGGYSFRPAFLNRGPIIPLWPPRGGGLEAFTLEPRARPELDSQARFSVAINWPYFLHHSDERLAGRYSFKQVTKSRNCLDVRSDIRLAVSKTDEYKGPRQKRPKAILDFHCEFMLNLVITLIYCKQCKVMLLLFALTNPMLHKIKLRFSPKNGGHGRVRGSAGSHGPKKVKNHCFR